MIFFKKNMDGLGEIGAFTLVKVQFPVQLLLQIFLSVFPQEYLHIFLPQLVQDWDHVKLTKHLFPLTQFCDQASPPTAAPTQGVLAAASPRPTGGTAGPCGSICKQHWAN